MNACAHVDEVEEFALGNLSGERALRAERHAAICESCAAALGDLVAERALFGARARTFAAPPPFSDTLAAIERERREAQPIKLAESHRRRVMASLAVAASVLALSLGAHALDGARDAITAESAPAAARAGAAPRASEINDEQCSSESDSANGAHSSPAARFASFASLDRNPSMECVDDGFAARASRVPASEPELGRAMCEQEAICSVQSP